MILRTDTFSLNKYGIDEVKVEIGDHEDLTSVSFNKDGINHLIQFVSYTPSKLLKSIVVDYYKYYRDGNLVPLPDLEPINKRFNAVVQESIEYFYTLTPSVPLALGETIEKMLVNGFLISQFGTYVFCYATSDGNFYPPTTCTVSVTDETGSEVITVIPAEYDADGNEIKAEETSVQWVGNNDGSVTITLIDFLEGNTLSEKYLFGITGKPASNADSGVTKTFTNLASGDYNVYAVSTPSMPVQQMVTVGKSIQPLPE